MASHITDETNDSSVVNPKRLQALSPNIHRSLKIVTTVIGMFNADTSKSAKARLRRKPLEIVRRAFLLVMTKKRVMFPIIEAVQIVTSMVASMILLAFAVILKQSFACSDEVALNSNVFLFQEWYYNDRR